MKVICFPETDVSDRFNNGSETTENTLAFDKRLLARARAQLLKRARVNLPLSYGWIQDFSKSGRIYTNRISPVTLLCRGRRGLCAFHGSEHSTEYTVNVS